MRISGPVRVLGFLGVLALVFAGALGVGYAVGPVSAPVDADMTDHVEGAEDSHGAAQAQAPDQEVPGGLMVSDDGYTFELQETTAESGADVPISFVIEGTDGRPVRAYDMDHGKQLHLIAVRRDLTGFQHVHPELGSRGTWSTALDLTPGTWRLFADFNPTGGVGLTLGADLSVAGDYRPGRASSQIRTDRVDGYTVALAGNLVPGADSELALTVERDGRPVTDLQPYLGAYGHLVVLREGDLAYLHVHPEGAPGDGSTPSGPEVAFEAEVPSDGSYRLFLDFRHEGVVHTAVFSVATSRGDQRETEGGSHGHGH